MGTPTVQLMVLLGSWEVAADRANASAWLSVPPPWSKTEWLNQVLSPIRIRKALYNTRHGLCCPHEAIEATSPCSAVEGISGDRQGREGCCCQAPLVWFPRRYFILKSKLSMGITPIIIYDVHWESLKLYTTDFPRSHMASNFCRERDKKKKSVWIKAPGYLASTVYSNGRNSPRPRPENTFPQCFPNKNLLNRRC